MAGREPAHDTEKGFGTGLRAQLGRRRAEEAAAESKAAKAKAKSDATAAIEEEIEPEEPMRVSSALPLQTEELNEERAVLEARASRRASRSSRHLRRAIERRSPRRSDREPI